LHGIWPKDRVIAMLHGGQISKHHDVSSDGDTWSSIKTHPDFAALFTPKPKQSPVEDEKQQYAVENPSDSASASSRPSGHRLKLRSKSQLSASDTIADQYSSVQAARPIHIATESAQWYYEHKGQVLGPISERELPSLIMSGAIVKDTQVCRQGGQHWITARTAFPMHFARPANPQTNNLHSGHDRDSRALPSGLGWCIEPWRKYAVFSGRSTRREYWAFYMFNFFMAFAMVFVEAATPYAGTIVSVVYHLIALLPSLAVLARRLHDTNYSGWFMLIGLIPILGFIILFVLCLRAGDPGPNNYGPNPRGQHVYA
jgi:uncharacterized membrane protein YhaH (DUF805 family)